MNTNKILTATEIVQSFEDGGNAYRPDFRKEREMLLKPMIERTLEVLRKRGITKTA